MNKDYNTDYNLINQQLQAITEGIEDQISNLANAASILFHSLEGINWAGFYILKEDVLMLGPFMGKPACVRIPMGNGVCGTAAGKGETILVPDVHKFPGHIACDSASLSEIVVPLTVRGNLFGVLDIDSPLLNRFSQEDKEGLEAFARILEEVL